MVMLKNQDRIQKMVIREIKIESKIKYYSIIYKVNGCHFISFIYLFI